MANTKRPPTWDFYLIKSEGTALIAKNVDIKTFLSKYFINLEQNIKSHPEYKIEDLITKYKEVWNSLGTIRSYYTDSWGHKWACFPHDKKLIEYLKHYL